MYYITNQSNQIIAADSTLFELLEIENVNELYKKVLLDELSFSSVATGDLTINNTKTGNVHTFSTENIALSSVFGDLGLHILHMKEEEEETQSLSPSFTESEEEPSSIIEKNLEDLDLDEMSLEEIAALMEGKPTPKEPVSEEKEIDLGIEEEINLEEPAVEESSFLLEDHLPEEASTVEEPEIDFGIKEETHFEEPSLLIEEEPAAEEPEIDFGIKEEINLEEPAVEESAFLLEDHLPEEASAAEEPEIDFGIKEETHFEEPSLLIEEEQPAAEEPKIDFGIKEETHLEEPAVEESSFLLEDHLPEESEIDFGIKEETHLEEPVSEESAFLFEDHLPEEVSAAEEPEIDFGVKEETHLEEPSSDDFISLFDEESSEPKSTEVSSIEIDKEAVSKSIGISTAEYTEFLNEFIDTAISLEKDLRSQDDKVRSIAVKTLVQLSELLHIPQIADATKAILTVPVSEADKAIEKLYHILAMVPTEANEKSEDELFLQMELESEIIPEEKPFEFATEPEISLHEEQQLEIAVEPEISLHEEQPLEIAVEPEISLHEETPAPILAITPEPEAEIAEEALPEGSFGHLTMDDLNALRPVHFDFRLEEAAGDLSLPVELIEEFVHDFIDQAHTETIKMLEYYKKGDLEHIQKIGHLLKGASSNLRINPLADTLYEIQFCEDSSRLEKLIKNYWAHFIAFEKQMKLSSK